MQGTEGRATLHTLHSLLYMAGWAGPQLTIYMAREARETGEAREAGGAREAGEVGGQQQLALYMAGWAGD